MRTLMRTGATLLLLGWLGTQLWAEKPSAIDWHTDWNQAARATVAAQRPLLVFFTMRNCLYCTQMKQTTYRTAEVAAQIKETYVAVQIDGTKHPQLARALGVRVYPTTAVLGAEGQVIDVMPGYIAAGDMVQRLSVARQKHTALLASARRGPNK